MTDQCGFYLAIDGSDGVGKSTLVNFIVKALRALGRDVIVHAEPERDGPLWPAIRDHRLSGEYPDEVWTLVLAAASLALQKRRGGTADLCSVGTWVVTDRSPLSILAHYWHSVDDGLLEALISRFIAPNLLIVLTPDTPELLRQRLYKRGEAADHINETVTAWKNYENAGLWLMDHGWVVAFINVTPDTTTEDLWQAVVKLLPC